MKACTDHLQLKKNHKNWMRKIQVAEVEGRKAAAILRKHGIPWHDEDDVNMDPEHA